MQARGFKENKWIGHEKGRFHCQGFGRLGVDRGCRGMVEGMRVGITEGLKCNDSKCYESISSVRYSQCTTIYAEQRFIR